MKKLLDEVEKSLFYVKLTLIFITVISILNYPQNETGLFQYLLFYSINFLQGKVESTNTNSLFNNLHNIIALSVLFKCAISQLSLTSTFCLQLNHNGDIRPTPTLNYH